MDGLPRNRAIVIDNGDDFRMDNRVPLDIRNKSGSLKNLRDHCNPNCSTIIALWRGALA